MMDAGFAGLIGGVVWSEDVGGRDDSGVKSNFGKKSKPDGLRGPDFTSCDCLGSVVAFDTVLSGLEIRPTDP